MSSGQHWIYFLSESLNLKFENTRITAKQAVVQEDLHRISVHAKSHNTLYKFVNLEDTTNVTFSGVVTHNTNPFQPTFYIMVWWLKERRVAILKLLLLVDEIRCFLLLIFAKILLFVDLRNWSRPFCFLTNSTWVTITYPRIQDMIIISVSISHFTVLLTKLVWVPICETKWF